MATCILPCQQFNSCNELVPRSRKLLSKDAQTVLGIFDRAVKKCILVLHMSDIMTEGIIVSYEKTIFSKNSETDVEDDVRKFATNLLELASAYEDLRTTLADQPQLKASELRSSSQECEEEQRGNQEDGTGLHEMTCVGEQSPMEQKPANASPTEEAKNETYLLTQQTQKVEKTVARMNEQREQIESLNNYMTGRVTRIQQEEEQKKEIIRNNSKAHQMELKQQLADRKNAYKKMVEINRTEESSQRATIFKVETELETFINKYDQEMTALQTEYDTLDEEYTKEKKELNELEERFLTLEEEYLEILEERRFQEEKRRREEEAQRALEQAVTTIQAFWRSYKTRKMVRGRRGAGRKGK
ncbi:uncharacterized protein DEA37_0011334 [Paragonimus westermani]|uniref:Dynein regulatory complex protein 10 n=1 Tax=Paragonimus westermani TaxID=34504 RepID=A0A5J4NCG1_9TREM|nr:uncharacterized protein DEA37_0011334 [Paragonimus westermani]